MTQASAEHERIQREGSRIKIHVEEHRRLLGEELDALDKHQATLDIVSEELEMINEYIEKSQKIKKDVINQVAFPMLSALNAKLDRDTKRRNRLRIQKDTLTKLIVILKKRIATHRKVVDRYERKLNE